MKKITLSNSFHDTEVTVLSNGETEAEVWQEIQAARWGAWASPAAKAKYRRVFNALCGNHDCCCGVVR